MRKLKLLTMAVLALALLAIPGTALAKSRDRDHDHMADKWEKRHHLNTHRKDGRGDPDRDGRSNLAEFREHTDPRDADSDNDGSDDGDEHRAGTNPDDPDTDNDGVEDGDEVSGTIASFDANTGVLTITTPNGDVTGNVVQGTTEIKCENEAEQEDVNDDRGDDDRGGVTDARHGSDDGDRGDDDASCTTADLTQGTAVHEAELNGSGQFTEVELVK
jgi:hypothetical protein